MPPEIFVLVHKFQIHIRATGGRIRIDTHPFRRCVGEDELVGDGDEIEEIKDRRINGRIIQDL